VKGERASCSSGARSKVLAVPVPDRGTAGCPGWGDTEPDGHGPVWTLRPCDAVLLDDTQQCWECGSGTRDHTAARAQAAFDRRLARWRELVQSTGELARYRAECIRLSDRVATLTAILPDHLCGADPCPAYGTLNRIVAVLDTSGVIDHVALHTQLDGVDVPLRL
jgi:hypothetical protein